MGSRESIDNHRGRSSVLDDSSDVNMEDSADEMVGAMLVCYNGVIISSKVGKAFNW